MRRALSSLLAITLGFIAVTSWTQHSAQSQTPFINAALAGTSTPLRVLSWNVQFGQGTDGITNFDRIATWLARMNPDIIALCEMPPDQIPTLTNLLTQKTGRTWYSHFVPKAPGINEGNLILSRYSFAAVNSQYLSYQRSIAQATINVGGRNINFFATHLDHTSSALRQTQVAELLQWTGGFAAPRIVCGDMNAANDTPEVLALLATYRDSWVDALNLGWVSLVPKPFTAEQLTRAVSDAASTMGTDLRREYDVLVVDDDPDSRRVAFQFLTEAGLRVRESSDGESALVEMHRRSPDVVVLDLMMPVLDGFGVLATMRADPVLSSVPVVVLTAKSLSEAERQFLSRSAVRVLQKGEYRLADVAALVLRAASGARIAPPSPRVTEVVPMEST